MEKISIIIPVSNEDVFRDIFLKSPGLNGDIEVLKQRDFVNSSEAFNNGVDKAKNDILVFCHQDVMLPKKWFNLFIESLHTIQKSDKNPGVIGCVGITTSGVITGHIYRHNRELVTSNIFPKKVRILDEMLISFRKSSNLRFDKELPGFLNYATDICLQAEELGYNNYVINDPCFHNSKNHEELPKQFYIARKYLVKKWSNKLPVITLSGILCKNKLELLKILKKKIQKIAGIKNKPWWERLPVINPENHL
ncbi:MAG TPA: glycosyltransferase [Chitinispirillaceae bacterium]|nr:glycosyltransferase [Chitinispirillaceae bacterium]